MANLNGTDQTFDKIGTPMLFTKSALTIVGWTWFCLIILGVICNAFLLAVSLHRDLRRTAHGVILIALSIVNGVSVLLKIAPGLQLLAFTYPNLHLLDYRRYSIGYCAISVLDRALDFSSSWFVVSLAADRIVSIGFPLRRLEWCTSSKALVVVAIIAITSLSIYTAALVTAMLLYKATDYYHHNNTALNDNHHDESPITSSMCKQLDRLDERVVHVRLTLVDWIPTLLLVASIVLLSCKLRCRVSKVKIFKLNDNMAVVLGRIQENNRLTLSCLCLFVKYVVLLLPKAIYTLWRHIQRPMRADPYDYKLIDSPTMPIMMMITMTIDAVNVTSPEYSNVTSPTLINNDIQYSTVATRYLTDDNEVTTAAASISLPVADGTSPRILLPVAEICDTLHLLSIATPFLILIATSDYFRRMLYHIMCPRRVTIDANLTSCTVRRLAINNRLDGVARTHRRHVVGLRLNSNQSSYDEDTDGITFECGVGIDRKTKTSTTEVSAQHVEVTMINDSLEEFDVGQQIMCAIPSVESVLNHTVQRLSDWQGHVASVSRNMKL